MGLLASTCRGSIAGRLLLGRSVGDDDGGRASLRADEVVHTIATGVAVGRDNALTPESDGRAELVVDGQAKLVAISAILQHEAVLGLAAGEDLGGQTGLAGGAEQVLGVVAAQLEGDGLDGLVLGAGSLGLADGEVGNVDVLAGDVPGCWEGRGRGGEDGEEGRSGVHVGGLRFVVLKKEERG